VRSGCAPTADASSCPLTLSPTAAVAAAAAVEAAALQAGVEQAVHLVKRGTMDPGSALGKPF